MALPNTSMYDSGFTLVEIIITLAIMMMVFSFGLFISFDVYRSYSFEAEKSILVSIFQKARNQSQNNINQVAHGVHLENHHYILFECPLGQARCQYEKNSNELVIEASFGLPIKNTLPMDVVFQQLSGNCADGPVVITMQQGQKFYNISINSDGQIDY